MIKPGPSKVEEVKKLVPPLDKAAVERLIETVNNLSKFVQTCLV